jgi:para-aminobenzoate synthetase / 4-amino-4-deoxychorismate lyase
MNQICVAIDWACPEGGAPWRYRFAQPLAVLQAHDPKDVAPLLASVHAYASAGHWCVGFVAFEAAPAFDGAFSVHAAITPLAWFAVFDHAIPVPSDIPWATPTDAPAHAHWDFSNLTTPRVTFDSDMAHIHQAIAAGEFYQINHTTVLNGRLTRGTPLSYFDALCKSQPGGYAAYIDTGSLQLLSVSPELFFDWNGQRVLCRPMKGTAVRGATPNEDEIQAQTLRNSPKEQAENVMIVDLIRNDVSRVAQPFSVKVPRIFHIEALPSVWQMTSDVTARTRIGKTWVDVLAALFPCGSVTGVPKVRAMQGILKLEPQARGVYCGAIGVVSPSGKARFNVAIRTVTVRGDQLQCGIGSAITTNATADDEWREWQHKRLFLEHATPPFALLETLALDQGVLRHASEHWTRLAQAAAHFGWIWGSNEQARLAEQVRNLSSSHPIGVWRVRCLVQPDGRAHIEVFPLETSPQNVILAVANNPFDAARSEFVRYKTTRRMHYENMIVHAQGIFDTLLYNPEGEITECVRGNIAALIDDQWVTPPLACGLLPGVGRSVALREGRLVEAVIRYEQTDRIQDWAFINSLRGWLPATVVEKKEKVIE